MTAESQSGASQPEWEGTRWWRCILIDGSLWAESSDEEEVREHAQRAPQRAFVQHLMRRVEEKWVDAPPHPDDPHANAPSQP